MHIWRMMCKCEEVGWAGVWGCLWLLPGEIKDVRILVELEFDDGAIANRKSLEHLPY